MTLGPAMTFGFVAAEFIAGHGAPEAAAEARPSMTTA